MDRHAQRHEEIDKELRAIRKILNIGVRQLAHMQERMADMQERMAELQALSKEHSEKINILIDAQIRLTEAQARTEASLQAFLDSMRKGNGRRAAR